MEVYGYLGAHELMGDVCMFALRSHVCLESLGWIFAQQKIFYSMHVATTSGVSMTSND